MEVPERASTLESQSDILREMRSKMQPEEVLRIYSGKFPEAGAVLGQILEERDADSVYHFLLQKMKPQREWPPGTVVSPEEFERVALPESVVGVALPEAPAVPVSPGVSVLSREELERRLQEQEVAGRPQTAPLPKPKEPYSVIQGMGLFARGLPMLPKQVAARVVTGLQGWRGASVTDPGWGDRLVESAQKDSEKFAREAAKKYKGKTFLPGISMEEVASLPQNMAYSISTMGPALAVGAPTALLPVPGARPLAYAAGSAVGGMAAYNMSSYEIMQSYLEVKNDDSVEKRGRGISKTEEKKLKKEFAWKARKYGLWEAGPEMLSGGAFVGTLLAPLTKIAGRSVAVRIAAKLGAMYGAEMGTEAITQVGQSGVQVAAGLPGAKKLDWTSPTDWLTALKEVAPQTFLLTTVMAGVGGTAVKTRQAVKSLKQEIGETHPMYQQFEAKIEESVRAPVEPTLPVTEPVEEPGAVIPGGRPAEEMPVAVERFAPEVMPEVPPTGKEPWQMTQDEFIPAGLPEEEAPRLAATRAHKESVQQALVAGKSVPPKVLASYPDLTPAPGARIDESGKSEPEFIDDSPPIGMSIRETMPPGVTVIKARKDLTGIEGKFKQWASPVRTIAMTDPVVNRLLHMGRDTTVGLANEMMHYADRTTVAFKDLKKIEEFKGMDRKAANEKFIDMLETEGRPAGMSPELAERYDQVHSMRLEARKMAEEDMKIAVEEWGMTPEQYWPHIFIGDRQIKKKTIDAEGKPALKTIDGGFARSQREAVQKVKAYFEEHHSYLLEPHSAEEVTAYLKAHDDANIVIVPRSFDTQYSATLLSRKGFWRFINEVGKASELDTEEVLSLLKGVAAIKPRGKFVGNFLQREVNLGGYIKDPIAFKIYMNRVLRKKWFDPFRKEATDLAASLPPGLREYFMGYIDDIAGKFDPIDNKFQVAKVAARMARTQSYLKLGYRPITAGTNRFQPMQLAFPEIGHYLFRGYAFKKTATGKQIIEDSGIRGQIPKYAVAEPGYKLRQKEQWWRPLGLFNISEMANREDVICGGYLYARKVFRMGRERASKRGLGYVYQYLDHYGNEQMFPGIGLPDAERMAALEYAKDLNYDVNFDYSAAGIPKMFRSHAGRVAFQFKTFPINFVATTLKWTIQKPNNPHYWARLGRFVAMNSLLGGVRTIPYIGRKNWKLIALAPLVIPLVGEDNRERVRSVFGRGIFTMFGVDMSQRLGPNEFLPRNIRDMLGPTAGDVYNIYRYVQGDADWPQLLRSVPAIRDLYRALAETEYIADENKRMRKMVEVSGYEKVLQALGIPLEKVQANRDTMWILGEMTKKYKRDKTKYVDRLIDQLVDAGVYEIGDDTKRATRAEAISKPLRDEALSNGIQVDLIDVDIERAKKGTSEAVRRLQTAPLDLKIKQADVIRKIHRTHGILGEEMRSTAPR